MRPVLTLATTILTAVLSVVPALSGEAEIARAQSSIDAQLKSFLADDDATAYSFAAPNVKKVFPTVDAFMSMVRSGYPMVHRSQNHAFGKVEEMGSRIVQQVLIQGQDGKDYEAVYQLEPQEDGTYRIIGVSLRASNALST